jgi:hypothetical protein
MVGWNYDIDKSQKMTADEREALRTLGGIAILGGFGYLWLTRQTPLSTKGLNLFDAGAFQDRAHKGFTITKYDLRETNEQTLSGFDLTAPIEIFAVHNGDDMNANIEATFSDGSTRSITKAQTSKTSNQFADADSTTDDFGDDVVNTSLEIDPITDFKDETVKDTKTISKYTVTLNVSGKGLTKAIRFTIGA